MSNQLIHYKSLSISSLLIIFGVITSGPIGSYFAQKMDIQSLPFYFGFILMFGFLLFFASIPQPKNEWERINGKLLIFFAGIYTFMISLNYMLQISLLPKIVTETKMVELLAVLNAKSFFWDLEMTGYGFLGMATFSASVFFHDGKKQEMIKLLCIANGIISVIGTFLTFIFPGWVLTIPGLISYVLWNVVIAVLAMYILLEYKFGNRIIISMTPYEKP